MTVSSIIMNGDHPAALAIFNYNNNNKLYFVKTGLHRKQYKIQIKFESKKYTVNLLN